MINTKNLLVYFLPFLLVFCLLIFLFIDEYNSLDNYFVNALTLYVFIFLIFVVSAIFTKRFYRWPAVSLSFILTFFIWYFQPDLRIYAKQFKIWKKPNYSSECIKKAKPIPGGGIIGVCEFKDNLQLMMADAIVYDSTDEINKDSVSRSQKWKLVANSLKEIRYGIEHYNIKKIMGHYYYIQYTY